MLKISHIVLEDIGFEQLQSRKPDVGKRRKCSLLVENIIVTVSSSQLQQSFFFSSISLFLISFILFFINTQTDFLFTKCPTSCPSFHFFLYCLILVVNVTLYIFGKELGQTRNNVIDFGELDNFIKEISVGLCGFRLMENGWYEYGVFTEGRSTHCIFLLIISFSKKMKRCQVPGK